MIPEGMSVGVAAAVLLVVLLIGVAAGRARSRWSLLLVGLVAVVALALVTTSVSGGPEPVAGDKAADLARFYSTMVPLAVVFVAGWICARTSWFRRLIVVGLAAVLLAAFPYAAAGRATAEFVSDTPAAASPQG